MLWGAVDRRGDRPAYRQIAAMIRDAIHAGQLTPGEQLPSYGELADQFGVALMTARQAVQELSTEGLISIEQGRGSFVRPRVPVRRLASDRFARRHREAGKAAFLIEAEKSDYTPGVDQIQISRGSAPAGVIERLRLETGDEVVIRARRYLANGQPVELATSYIPVALADGTPISEPNPGPGGIYARLEEAGHTLARFSEDVGARMPTAEEARQLKLPSSTPVLTVIRTAYDTNDHAVEVCDTVKSALAYVLQYDFSAH
ncbi:GntR family transcriptional regulator [Fodinicola acaciae]|uniref:GntR family transcriptional regulator n=1 Tax=Fodinicola acaciae TaxID=2681555 RepID=UPI003CCCC771